MVSLRKRGDTGGQYQLYHLPDDPAELKDVSAQHPERVKAMTARMDEIVAVGRSR